MSGDDLAILLFFLSTAFAFGFEAMRAETIPRRIVFSLLSGASLVVGVFWTQVKTLWPPFTAAVVSIATSPVSWFAVAMFILAIFAFHRPNTRRLTKPEPIRATEKRAKTTDGRVFVDATPDYLRGLFVGRTRLQGQKLAEQYIGKWLRVTGTVNDIFDVFVVLREPQQFGAIYLYFDDVRKEEFTLLQQGKMITAVGKISEIHGNGFDLRQCEIKS